MKTILEYIQKQCINIKGPVWAVICGVDYEEISDWIGPYDSEEECLKDLEYADINTKELSVKDDGFFAQIAILSEEELVKQLKAEHLYEDPLQSNCNSVEEFAEHWLNIVEI